LSDFFQPVSYGVVLLVFGLMSLGPGKVLAFVNQGGRSVVKIGGGANSIFDTPFLLPSP